MIGDIVGRPGRQAVRHAVHQWKIQRKWDLVLANGENAAGGNGLSAVLANELRGNGVQGITLGDHVWDQKGFDQEIVGLDYVCRPANLPEQCPGRTELVFDMPNGRKFAVLTVLGRTFMSPCECPFKTAKAKVEALRAQGCHVLVEIHAEATSEKIALGHYLDGLATAVVGTHTHVPTADAGLLNMGTGFICDIGMTGPYHSVLGREISPVLGRFLDGMPRRFPVADADVRFSAVEIEYHPETGRCEKIELFHRRLDC